MSVGSDTARRRRKAQAHRIPAAAEPIGQARVWKLRACRSHMAAQRLHELRECAQFGQQEHCFVDAQCNDATALCRHLCGQADRWRSVVASSHARRWVVKLGGLFYECESRLPLSRSAVQFSLRRLCLRLFGNDVQHACCAFQSDGRPQGRERP